MTALLKMMSGRAAAPLYVDDVFSSYLRTGTGAEATVTNGIDLSTNGGLVWTKARSAATGHRFTDTARGATYSLDSSATSAQATEAEGIKSFSTTGYVVGTDTDYNNSTGPVTYVDWTFRKAPKFFDVQTATVTGGADATVSFTDLETLGMVIVKRTDSTGSWYVWHRSLTAGKLLYLEQTAAEATLGQVTVSGTTVTLEGGVIADGTYIVYGYAHDTATDGMIQCGSFTTDGSGNATVSLGWEPQWLMFKNSTGAADNWYQGDTMRGLLAGDPPITNGFNYLIPNLSNAEAPAGITIGINSTGFKIYYSGGGASKTYIYLAIRRPNKPPTSGTQVYSAGARTGTGAAATTTAAGFPVDLVITKKRSSTTLTGARFVDRLRGKTNWLDSSATTAETSTADTITGLDVMTGVVFGADATTSAFNTNTHTYVDEYFRRAPGVFDAVCYTGTGAAHTEAHNLGAVPELMIVKWRTGGTNQEWAVYAAPEGATKYAWLNSTGAFGANQYYWNNTSPTASVFTVGIANNVNNSGWTYVAYLFATLAGISKVGSYTGNGSTQTINCGFTTGARFFLVKATSTTGNWVVFDSARGIVAGNDPYLLLNSTAAEDTDEDAVDADNSGIIVNETSASAINTNGVTYIFLAFA